MPRCGLWPGGLITCISNLRPDNDPLELGHESFGDAIGQRLCGSCFDTRHVVLHGILQSAERTVLGNGPGLKVLASLLIAS